MYNIIPLILILVSLAVIISIVTRKFSVLANLNLDTIPAEREAKFKERIISNRIKRSYYKYYAKLIKLLRPVGGLISGFFKWGYKKLVEFKENYNRESEVESEGTQIIPKLFREVDELIKAEEFEKAEEKLIEIIGLDSKNIQAFKELGCLYYDRKDYNEAKQTLEHALKLIEQEEDIHGDGVDAETSANTISAGIYFEMSLVMRAMDNLQGCLDSISRALKLEPNNPRYLDSKLEISIINKDKPSALEAYEKLAEVNPENNKLPDLKKQIDEL